MRTRQSPEAATMSWEAISYVCVAVTLSVTVATGFVARRMYPASPPWRALIWPIYGFVLAGLSLWSVHFALFALGIVAPLLNHNVYQLWFVECPGKAGAGQPVNVSLFKGARFGYLLAVLSAIAIRSSPGIVLLLGLPRGNPFAYLGMGILVSGLGSIAGAFRILMASGQATPPPGSAPDMAQGAA
jgi:hypothetical protein